MYMHGYETGTFSLITWEDSTHLCVFAVHLLLVLIQIFPLSVIFQVQDSTDYQGRSYLHIPKDIDIKLDTDQPPERCYLPKKHIHTWWVKDVYVSVLFHSCF